MYKEVPSAPMIVQLRGVVGSQKPDFVDEVTELEMVDY